MAVQTILPTTNLKWDDIRDTLNANGGSVTNDVASAFSTNANINMWAKNKPDNVAKDFDITDTDRANANHNFIVVYKDGYKPNEVYWRFATPTAPFRLGDFRGYNPKALPPIFISSITNSNWNLYLTKEPDFRIVAAFKYNGTMYHGSYAMEIDINEVKSGVSDTSMNYGINMKDLYLCIAETENSYCISDYALKEGNSGGLIDSIKGSTLYTSLQNKGVGTYPLNIFLTSSPSYINKTFPLPNATINGTDVSYSNSLPSMNFTIEKDFWLKFSIRECNVTVSAQTVMRFFGMDSVSSTTATLYNWENILNYPDSTVLTLDYTIYARRKSANAEKIIDVNMFTINTSLHPSEVPGKISTIKIVSYYNGSSVTSINVTLLPESNPSYELDRYDENEDASYAIQLSLQTTVEKLKGTIEGLKYAGSYATSNLITTLFSNNYEVPNSELYYNQTEFKFKLE